MRYQPLTPRTKVVGEPDEGKPHVRFDVAGDENQNKVMAFAIADIPGVIP